MIRVSHYKDFLNILNIHNELQTQGLLWQKYVHALKKMLLCVQIKLLVVEVALGGISNNQSLEY